MRYFHIILVFYSKNKKNYIFHFNMRKVIGCLFCQTFLYKVSRTNYFFYYA